MKNLILILLFFPSLSFATWRDGSMDCPAYSTKHKCEKIRGKDCFNDNGQDHRILKVGFKAVDVLETVDCENEEACQETIFLCKGSKKYDLKSNWPSLNWSYEVDGKQIDRPTDGYFIWCEEKGLIIDSVKQQELQQIEAAQAEALVLQKDGAEARQFGNELTNFLVGYIKSKKLPKENRKQLRQSFKDIIDALEIGSIDIAKEAIAELPVDGLVVTDEIKATIIKKITDAGY